LAAALESAAARHLNNEMPRVPLGVWQGPSGWTNAYTRGGTVLVWAFAGIGVPPPHITVTNSSASGLPIGVCTLVRYVYVHFYLTSLPTYLSVPIPQRRRHDFSDRLAVTQPPDL